MEKYSLLKLTAFTNGQLGHILANEMGFKGTVPDPKATDYRMRVIDIICDLQDGKKPANSSFVVADHFTLDNTTIRFSHISEDFNSFFSDLLVEKMIRPQTTMTLSRTALDSEIIAYIGGEDKAEVTLSGIYEMLKNQPNGQKGELLTDGMANIFYVLDTFLDELCPIVVYWDIAKGGWNVDTFLFDDPTEFGKTGSCVFYR